MTLKVKKVIYPKWRGGWKLLKVERIKRWLELQRVLSVQSNCPHKEWDMDSQIRTIKCRKCGKTAWVKEIKNLYGND